MHTHRSRPVWPGHGRATFVCRNRRVWLNPRGADKLRCLRTSALFRYDHFQQWSAIILYKTPWEAIGFVWGSTPPRAHAASHAATPSDTCTCLLRMCSFACSVDHASFVYMILLPIVLYLALIVSMTVYLQARIWRLIGEMDQAKLNSTEPASTCADTKPEDLPR